MVLLFAIFCVCAVAGKPAFKFNWTPPLQVIPHGLPDVHVRIVGGVEAEPHMYGYQAVLIRGMDFICGAVVVSEQFVLTAAHCVTRKEVKYLALMGGHDISVWEESHQMIDVEKVFIHPNYTLYTEDPSNDIAVLKLKTEIQMNEKVFPIDLPMDNVYDGMPLLVTGWGLTKTGVQPFSFLQKMTTSTIEQSNCSQTYPWLDNSMFCGYVPDSPGTICNGDSGGPAVYNSSLVGIISFAANGCSPMYPQGFTNVFKAKDWIEDVMKGLVRSSSGPSTVHSFSSVFGMFCISVYLSVRIFLRRGLEFP